MKDPFGWGINTEGPGVVLSTLFQEQDRVGKDFCQRNCGSDDI